MTQAAIEFISALFGENTEQPIFFQSLANDKSDEDEAGFKPRLLTRDVDPITRFVKKHDRNRRGMFFCVATVARGSPTRDKTTVRETIGLHVDIDFKGVVEDEPAIRARIAGLRCQPTVIVRSGGGLHLYWLFKESADTQTYREPIEIALKRLADIVAGDLSVCEVARLMRLPGSHNSKYGDMREVVCERLDGPRYELPDLEEWMDEQQPVLTRKPIRNVRNADAADDNPYLKHAREWGYKPRLDVEATLADMADGNIHNSLLRSSASLIRRGVEFEQAVAILMEASRLKGGPDWDWREQEKEIRGMCVTAQKFVPKEPPPPDAPPYTQNEPPPEVVDLNQARAKRKLKTNAIAIHITLAQVVRQVLEDRGYRLLFTTKGCYRYADGLWGLLDDRVLKSWLDAAIEDGARGLRIESTTRLVSEARAYIVRSPDLQIADLSFDRHGKVPTASGLICPIKGTIEPCRPEHYCTWRIPFEYDPAATCPLWLQMLGDTFADRPEAVRASYFQLLQEWLGMMLIDGRSKALSRILFFQGGSNFGKSEVIDVLAGIFGQRRNTTPLDMLDKPHGLMPFAHRTPWVLPEAFDQGKWHVTATVKALVSGEPVQINMKNSGIFDHTFTGPVIWGANGEPQFKEATAAMINRLLIVACRSKFEENETVGVGITARAAGFDKPSQLILATEMGGVLAWAVQGLLRARARGYFLIPDESRAAGENVQLGSNIAAGFVRDCVTFDPDCMVSVPDFAAGFASWWAELKGGERGVPGSESVSKALKALAEPRIAFDLRDNSRRYYAGVRLNVEGRRYWSNAVTSDAYLFQSRKASTTESGGEPNRAVPTAWDGREAVEAMRAAHAKSVTARGDGSPGQPSPGGVSSRRNSTLSPQLSSQLSRDDAADPPDEIPF